MTFIIEYDGPVTDLRPVYYEVYREVATAVGWSRLDEASYWRLIRTRGREAVVLPGARPGKVKTFWTKFDRRVEEDDVVAMYGLRAGIEDALATIARHGPCCLITVGSNITARRRLVEKMGLADRLTQMERLDNDPRRRPGELRMLGGEDRRTVVVAGSDAVARSAGQAEMLTVGISSGSCTASRLHRAGADIVYSDISELAESLQGGAKDLIQAGLLPPAM